MAPWRLLPWPILYRLRHSDNLALLRSPSPGLRFDFGLFDFGLDTGFADNSLWSDLVLFSWTSDGKEVPELSARAHRKWRVCVSHSRREGAMAQYAHPEVLVDTQWVTDHNKDNKVRVFRGFGGSSGL